MRIIVTIIMSGSGNVENTVGIGEPQPSPYYLYER